MLWECFSIYDIRSLFTILGRLNAKIYCSVFDNHALSTLWHLYQIDPWYFQDDNDICHRERETMIWYGDNGVQRQEQLSLSLPFNSIEHHSDKLERRQKWCSHRTTSLTELTCVLQAKWEKIPVSSYNARLRACPGGSQI